MNATTQQAVTRSDLVARLHPAQHGRITVDATADYTRSDGDTRLTSLLPALVLVGGHVEGECYDADQAEVWLVRHPTDARIVCRDA